MYLTCFSQLNTRYFVGLQGQYRFHLEFLVRKVNSTETLAEGRGYPHSDGRSDSRSVNCEIYLEPGTYEVLPKITAERRGYGKAVERVVQIHADKNPKKLRQVGMQYDLAHAKAGVLDEDAEQELKREKDKEKRKKQKKKQDKVDQMSDAMARMQVAINSLQLELKKKGKQKEKEGDAEGEKLEDPIPAKVEDKEPKDQGQQAQKRDQTNETPLKEYSPPGFWPGDSFRSTSQLAEAGRQAQTPSADGSRDEKRPNASDMAVEPAGKNRVTNGEGSGQRKDAPIPTPSPSPVPTPQPDPERQSGPASDNESDSSSDSETDNDSDSDSSEDGMNLPETSDDRNPPWNPVCVMFLRVYAQDRDVSVKLVEKDEHHESKPSNEEAKIEGPKAEIPNEEMKA